MTRNGKELFSMEALHVILIHPHPELLSTAELSCLRQGYRYGN